METSSNDLRRVHLLYDITDEPPVPCEFKVGDKVTLTTRAGDVYRGLEVAGFGKAVNPELRPDAFIYLEDWHCYWYATSPDMLKLESRGDASQEAVVLGGAHED